VIGINDLIGEVLDFRKSLLKSNKNRKMIITPKRIFGRIKKGKKKKRKFSLMIDLKFFRKYELQQVRKWIKSLPTYSASMMEGTWQVLDPTVINEVDRSVKAHYAVINFSCSIIITFLCLIETSYKKCNEKNKSRTNGPIVFIQSK
jgi:hypothetical protein